VVLVGVSFLVASLLAGLHSLQLMTHEADAEDGRKEAARPCFEHVMDSWSGSLCEHGGHAVAMGSQVVCQCPAPECVKP
jgi:hypothetical protein